MEMSAVVLVTTFAVGNFYHLSIATNMYASLFNLSGRGPAKSNWTSSLGWTTGSIRNECFFPIISFKFLPCSVQCLQLCAIWTMVLRMWGNQTCWHKSSIAPDPGCVRWRLFVSIVLVLQFSHLFVSNPPGHAACFGCCANIVHMTF